MSSPDPSPGQPPDDGGDEGVNLGLVVGVPLAAIVLAVGLTILGICLYRWKKYGKDKMNPFLGLGHRSRSQSSLQREKKKASILVRLPSRQDAELYVVRHYYKAEDGTQITLETGRIVEVLEKNDNGWWRGTVDDQEGWFPATYLKKLEVGDNAAESGGHDNEQTDVEGARPTPGRGVDNGGLDVSRQDVTLQIEGAVTVEQGTHSEDAASVSGSEAGEREGGASPSNSDQTDSLCLMVDDDVEGYINDIFSIEDESGTDSLSKDVSRKVKVKANVKAEVKKRKMEQVSQRTKGKSVGVSVSRDTGGRDVLQDGESGDSGSGTIPSGMRNNQEPEKSLKKVSAEDLKKASDSVESGGEDGEPGSEYLAGSPASRHSHPDTDAMIHSDESDEIKADQEVLPAHRGAPDGSSLVDALTDCGKHLQAQTEGLGGEEEADEADEKDGLNDLRDSLAPPEGSKVFVAMYPYQASEDSQLSLSRNDVIVCLEEADSGWVRGRLRRSGDTGWFPAAYVREGKSPLGPILRHRHSSGSEDFDSEDEFDDNLTGMEYRTLYPYEALQDGDLTMAEGDTVVVLETLDSGWWRGCVGQQEGWFPGSYVEPVPQTPSTPSELKFSLTRAVENGDLATSGESPVGGTTSSKTGREGEVRKGRRLTLPMTLKSKPQAPRRFVVPRLVKIPKNLFAKKAKAGGAGRAQPSRPPPPVPTKAHYGKSISVDDTPTLPEISRDRNEVLDDLALVMRAGRDLRSVSLKDERHSAGEEAGGHGKRRPSVQRPLAPPPAPPAVVHHSETEAPAPTTPHGERERSQDSPTSGTDPDASTASPVKSESPGSEVNRSVSSDPDDSSVAFDSRESQRSLLAVVTAHLQDRSPSSSKQSESGTPESGTPGTTPKADANSPEQQPADVRKLLKRFEASGSQGPAVPNIIVKANSDKMNGDATKVKAESSSAVSRPPLPPKPDPAKLRYRRTRSEPNLGDMGLVRLSPSDPPLDTPSPSPSSGPGGGVAGDTLRSPESPSKQAAGPPAAGLRESRPRLPAKVPRQQQLTKRSRSVGSLLNPGAPEGSLSLGPRALDMSQGEARTLSANDGRRPDKPKLNVKTGADVPGSGRPQRYAPATVNGRGRKDLHAGLQTPDSSLRSTSAASHNRVNAGVSTPPPRPEPPTFTSQAGKITYSVVTKSSDVESQRRQKASENGKQQLHNGANISRTSRTPSPNRDPSPIRPPLPQGGATVQDRVATNDHVTVREDTRSVRVNMDANRVATGPAVKTKPFSDWTTSPSGSTYQKLAYSLIQAHKNTRNESGNDQKAHNGTSVAPSGDSPRYGTAEPNNAQPMSSNDGEVSMYDVSAEISDVSSTNLSRFHSPSLSLPPPREAAGSYSLAPSEFDLSGEISRVSSTNLSAYMSPGAGSLGGPPGGPFPGRPSQPPGESPYRPRLTPGSGPGSSSVTSTPLVVDTGRESGLGASYDSALSPSISTVSDMSSPTSPLSISSLDSSSALRFYTPAGFVPRRNPVALDLSASLLSDGDQGSTLSPASSPPAPAPAPGGPPTWAPAPGAVTHGHNAPVKIINPLYKYRKDSLEGDTHQLPGVVRRLSIDAPQPYRPQQGTRGVPPGEEERRGGSQYARAQTPPRPPLPIIITNGSSDRIKFMALENGEFESDV